MRQAGVIKEPGDTDEGKLTLVGIAVGTLYTFKLCNQDTLIKMHKKLSVDLKKSKASQ